MRHGSLSVCIEVGKYVGYVRYNGLIQQDYGVVVVKGERSISIPLDNEAWFSICLQSSQKMCCSCYGCYN